MTATTTATTEIEDELSVPARETSSTPKKRKRTPMLLAALVSAAALGVGGYYVTHLHEESTDDAQVEGRVINVSARVSGEVLRVHVEDNQVVNAGDLLVELDPADFAAKAQAARAELAAAKAAADGARSALALTEKTAPASLEQAHGGATAAAASVISARAAIEQAKADVTAASSRRALAELNFKRAQSLVDGNSVAIVELDTRKTELDTRKAEEAEARARLTSAESSLAGSSGGVVLATGRLHAAETASEQVASSHAALALADARVEQAEAALKLAELNLGYTAVRATRRGVVSRRSVEQGQMVSPDRPLFAIVPLDDVWVVANFKEDQLEKMHQGERATVQVDTYGSRKFIGHVDSLSGGTGARFALLPPDNATGNFVKVVQRVPVLIRLDAPSGVELRPGMSADVTVETR